MTYNGKSFEQDFVASSRPDLKLMAVIRLYDTTNGFHGVKNPCDFILGTRVGTVLVELKTTTKASLTFKNITEYQWEKLAEFDQFSHVASGVLAFFQATGELKWIPIRQLLAIREAGKKSLNPTKDFDVGYKVDFRLKRTRIAIDFASLEEAFLRDWEDRNG